MLNIIIYNKLYMALLNGSSDEKFGIILTIIGLIFLIITTYIGFTTFGVWSDEIFSILMINLPFKQFLAKGFTDVHPLLYYFIYKVIFKISLLWGYDNPFILGKILSLIPIYLLVLLSFTKIRKNFGMLTSGIFTLCICAMPRIMIYAVELRMYSWALFFVTASYIYLYDLIDSPNRKSWIIFTILTICSAYTHYFSAVASFCIYILFLVYLVKNNKELKIWFLSALTCIIAYIPALYIVSIQFTRVSNGFWIDPISLKTVISYVYFILSPANEFVPGNQLISPTIIGSLLLISIIYLFYKKRDTYTSISFLVVILVPLIGIVISFIMHPFFHQRYLVPVIGCLWIGFSILLAKFWDDKKIFIPVICIVLIISTIGCVDFIKMEENDLASDSYELNDLNLNMGKNDIIIHDHISSYNKFRFYMMKENENIYFNNSLVENVNNTLNSQNIQHKINNGSKVFFIDGKHENASQLRNAGFNLIEIKIYQPTYGEVYKAYLIDTKRA